VFSVDTVEYLQRGGRIGRAQAMVGGMLGVVLSAIVPTAIAQRWFSPDVEAEQQADQQREARVSGGRTAPQPIPAGEQA